MDVVLQLLRLAQEAAPNQSAEDVVSRCKIYAKYLSRLDGFVTTPDHIKETYPVWKEWSDGEHVVGLSFRVIKDGDEITFAAPYTKNVG